MRSEKMAIYDMMHGHGTTSRAQRIVVQVGDKTINYYPLQEQDHIEYRVIGQRIAVHFPNGGKCDETGAMVAVPMKTRMSFGQGFVALVENERETK